MKRGVLRHAIDKYGVLCQIDMLHEEMGELLQAINKLKRMGGITNDAIYKPAVDTSAFDGTKYSLAYNGLCSEVADVKIMIAQMELMLDEETIALCVDRKIKRLEERLKV